MVAVADRIDGWRNDPPRRLIHRESFRASVLHHSGSPAVPQSIAAKKCLLTTPSLLSKATQEVFWAAPPARLLPSMAAPFDPRSPLLLANFFVSPACENSSHKFFLSRSVRAEKKRAFQKTQNIRGKIKNVGAPTFSVGGIPPCFWKVGHYRETNRPARHGRRPLQWRGKGICMSRMSDMNVRPPKDGWLERPALQ